MCVEPFRIRRRWNQDFGDEYNARLEATLALLPRLDVVEHEHFQEFLEGLHFHHRDNTAIMAKVVASTRDAARLREVLGRVWALSEPDDTDPAYLKAFRTAAFVSDSHFPRPESAQTLYRGTISTFKRGLSWTTSISIARFFAMRTFLDHVNTTGLRESADVYRIRVEPDAILGFFATESEYVVDYPSIDPEHVERLNPDTAFDEASLAFNYRPDRPPLWTLLPVEPSRSD